jgi:predicted phage tail protein
MRVKIIPHGALRHTWPTDFECEAETAYEAVTALTCQFNLGRPSPTERWTVALVGHDTEVALHCPLRSPELHIVPAFVGGGGGNGGFMKIALGAVLIAVSFVIPAGWAAAGFALNTAAFNLGASLVLGGILEMISPAPKSNTAPTNNRSEYLGAPKNTTASGTPIQIGYGRFAVYGHFLSFNIETDPAPVKLASDSQGTSTDYRRGDDAYGYRVDSGEGGPADGDPDPNPGGFGETPS